MSPPPPSTVLPSPAASTAAPMSAAAHFRRFLTFCGPTWLLAVMFVDPGGITAALDQGSQTRFALLWISWWSIVFGYFFQELAARVSIVCGRPLAELCAERYASSLVRYAIWVTVEISVFGDDFQAAVGACVALNIVFGIPYWIGVLLTIAVSVLLTIAYYASPSGLEITVGVLLMVLMACVFVDVGRGHAPLGDVLYGWVVPRVPPGQVVTVVSSIGGVLTPSAVFLGSRMVLTRAVDRSSPRDVRRCIAYSIAELAVGAVVSFLVMLAVTVTFANGFYRKECAARVQAWVPAEGECGDISLGDGPDALSSVYGSGAKWVFATALLLSGVTSMVTATLAGQVLWEGFTKRKVAFWKRVTVTRAVVLVPTLALALSVGESDALFTKANGWVNIFMSLAMPMATIPALHMAASASVMRGMALSAPRVAFTALMIAALVGINFYLIAEFLFRPASFGSAGSFPTDPAFYSFVGALLLFYCYVLFKVSQPGIHDLRVWCGFAAPEKSESLGWDATHDNANADEKGKECAEQDDVSAVTGTATHAAPAAASHAAESPRMCGSS